MIDTLPHMPRLMSSELQLSVQASNSNSFQADSNATFDSRPTNPQDLIKHVSLSRRTPSSWPRPLRRRSARPHRRHHASPAEPRLRTNRLLRNHHPQRSRTTKWRQNSPEDMDGANGSRTRAEQRRRRTAPHAHSVRLTTFPPKPLPANEPPKASQAKSDSTASSSAPPRPRTHP